MKTFDRYKVVIRPAYGKAVNLYRAAMPTDDAVFEMVEQRFTMAADLDVRTFVEVLSHEHRVGCTFAPGSDTWLPVRAYSFGSGMTAVERRQRFHGHTIENVQTASNSARDRAERLLHVAAVFDTIAAGRPETVR